MVNYIEIQNLLYSSQYGFRKGHSTQYAILELLNDIQTNMNKKLFSCGVFIDLKKTFDTVDHNILLNKLNHYGFRGIVNDWFSSYLKNRIQTTQVGQHISSKVEVSCGVPQGSVLGPSLFLLYVNDMYKCSDKLKFYLSADDRNILYADKNMKALESTVNIELRNL
jgi:retron-type reverse transcriptase